jgi:threonylcarbamoyladenosine tRNA methylthiotransferase MtaB
VTDLNVTTDIIVGFPGETEEEWQQSLDFVYQADFGEVHLFPYSPRQGTKAASLPGQVDESTKRQRCQQLSERLDAQRPERLQRQVGRRVPVLIERGQEHIAAGRPQGYTPNLQRCLIDLPAGHPELTGQIHPITIERVEQGQYLWGQLAE